jgi:hypothetical protein
LVVETDEQPQLQRRTTCYACGEEIGLAIGNQGRKLALDPKPRRYGQFALLGDGIRVLDLTAPWVPEKYRLADTPRFVLHSTVCDARGLRLAGKVSFTGVTPFQELLEAKRAAKLAAERSQHR